MGPPSMNFPPSSVLSLHIFGRPVYGKGDLFVNYSSLCPGWVLSRPGSGGFTMQPILSIRFGPAGELE